jgi:hypothetical protein
LKKLAWLAFGIYLLSLALGGFLGFWLRFMCCLVPLTPHFHAATPGVAFPRGDTNTTLLAISWLANPNILSGMLMLGKGTCRGAAIAGIVSILLALCAGVYAFLHPILAPSYLGWVASMALVVVSAIDNRHLRGDSMRLRRF